MLHAYDLSFSCKCNWISDYIMDDLIMTCLLLLPESKKTDTGDLDDLETDTGNITLRLTPATEAGDEDLVVLVDEVQATIILRQRTRQKRDKQNAHHHSPGRARTHETGLVGECGGDVTHRHESGDLLAVLDKLHTDALADGRVGLLGLNADLLKHDALRVGRSTSGGRLVDVAQGALFVRLGRRRVCREISNRTREGAGRTHPAVLAAVVAQLARCLQSTRFVG